MTKQFNPDDVEARLFLGVSSRRYDNPRICVTSLRMRDLVLSPALDAPLMIIVGERFPNAGHGTWRAWLRERQKDLAWVQRCCALDGFTDDVPEMGPMIFGGDRRSALIAQKGYNRAGGETHSGGARALFWLICEVLSILEREVPWPNDGSGAFSSPDI